MRALTFLDLTRYSTGGNQDIAIFDVERSTHLYLKTTPLKLIGDYRGYNRQYPPENELKSILEEAIESIREAKEAS